MNAKISNAMEFLRRPNQYIIPIFQRRYSWGAREWSQLWNDIVHAGSHPQVDTHFTGSIVYVAEGIHQASSLPKYLVVDGQQRLATLTLLITALSRVLDGQESELDLTRRKVENYFLLNAEEEGELRYKLLLTEADAATLTAIVAEKDLPDEPAKQLVRAYDFFRERITEGQEDLATIWRGVQKLVVVDLALDGSRDDPQLIFESLNNTGKGLSASDLIRNFILMRLQPHEQKDLYERYWRPLEQIFDGMHGKRTSLTGFVRDYLAMRTGAVPGKNEEYPAFKRFRAASGQDARDLMQDLLRFARLFARIAGGDEADPSVREGLSHLDALNVDSVRPLLLRLMDAWQRQQLEKRDLLAVLELVESFLFRRRVCGVSASSLNRLFADLAFELDPEELEVGAFLSSRLLEGREYDRFPRDEEFVQTLVVRDVYTPQFTNYMLSRLENHGRKERVDIGEYTIEHVLPQNENLSQPWQEMLGSDWRVIQERYLHTIGNLTLTGYNSEMSDRPFLEKRDMVGGFRDSPLRLNRSLAQLDHWDEQAIIDRARALAQKALEVWACPDEENAGAKEVKDRTPVQVSSQIGAVTSGRERATALLEAIRQSRPDLIVSWSPKREVAHLRLRHDDMQCEFGTVCVYGDDAVVNVRLPEGELGDPQRLFVRQRSNFSHHYGEEGRAEMPFVSLAQLAYAHEHLERAACYREGIITAPGSYQDR